MSNKAADQTARIRMLLCVFIVHICHEHVLLLWFILIVFVLPFSDCLRPFVHFISVYLGQPGERLLVRRCPLDFPLLDVVLGVYVIFPFGIVSVISVTA